LTCSESGKRNCAKCSRTRNNCHKNMAEFINNKTNDYETEC
jgi:hypothetical protein